MEGSKTLLHTLLSDFIYTLPQIKLLTHSGCLWQINNCKPMRGQNMASSR